MSKRQNGSYYASQTKSRKYVDKKLIKISYIVTQKMSQQKKSHTIGETLIMPCATEIVREMYDFAVRLDESTYVSKMSYLLAYVR